MGGSESKREWIAMENVLSKTIKTDGNGMITLVLEAGMFPFSFADVWQNKVSAPNSSTSKQSRLNNKVTSVLQQVSMRRIT